MSQLLPVYANMNRQFVNSRVKERYNDMIASHLHQLNVLPIERIWKFERRSHDYQRMYRDVAKDIADGIIPGIHQKD